MQDEFPDSPDFWREPDFLLADLVSGLVNKGGLELGVTLFVKGLVITGTLTSEKEYLTAITQLFTEQAKRALVNPSRQDLDATEEAFDFTNLAEDVDLTELYGERADEFDEPDDDEADDDKGLDDGWIAEFPALERELNNGAPAIRYLHLKEPTVIQPQPAVSFTHSDVPILRIRLTTIDGWMVGRVNVESSDDLTDFPPYSPNDIRH